MIRFDSKASLYSSLVFPYWEMIRFYSKVSFHYSLVSPYWEMIRFYSKASFPPSLVFPYWDMIQFYSKALFQSSLVFPYWEMIRFSLKRHFTLHFFSHIPRSFESQPKTPIISPSLFFLISSRFSYTRQGKTNWTRQINRKCTPGCTFTSSGRLKSIRGDKERVNVIIHVHSIKR